MPFEFHEEPGDVEMWIDDIDVPGVYYAEEQGSGIHEEYKAEVESRSGGQDTADEPPAAVINAEAYIEQETFDALNELRDSEEPFEVQIGPFAYEQMGIANMEATVLAEETNSMSLNIKLQEYREVIIQERSMSQQGGGSAGLDGSGPAAAWVDEDGDGFDDRTGEELPEMQSINVASGQEVTENVGSDEGFGRVLVDVTSGGGARFQVNTDGQNWAVQDIGIRGQAPNPGNWTNFNLTERGGQSLVRHIYNGDGSAGSNSRSTGMWTDPDGGGDIVFEYVNSSLWGDNGLYANPISSYNSGTVAVRNSFFYNNGISNIRVGQGTVENCVAYNDGGASSSWGGRVLWCWDPGPIDVINCDLDMGPTSWVLIAGGNNGPTTVNLQNTRMSGNQNRNREGSTVNGDSVGEPNLDNIHQNVPGSPASAAAGIGGGSGGGGGSE